MKMFSRAVAALAALVTLSTSPLLAASITFTPSGSQSTTFGAFSNAGAVTPGQVQVDQNNVPFGTTANPFHVDTSTQATGTDRGGTIAVGGTAQTFAAANASRRGLFVQNQSVNDLYLNCIATATTDYHSMKIPAGALYEMPSAYIGPGACSIIGATTGQVYFGREY